VTWIGFPSAFFSLSFFPSSFSPFFPFFPPSSSLFSSSSFLPPFLPFLSLLFSFLLFLLFLLSRSLLFTLSSLPLPSFSHPLLLFQYLERLELAPVFKSEEEIAHWFLPRPDIVTCYVVEVRAHGVFGGGGRKKGRQRRKKKEEGNV